MERRPLPGQLCQSLSNAGLLSNVRAAQLRLASTGARGYNTKFYGSLTT